MIGPGGVGGGVGGRGAAGLRRERHRRTRVKQVEEAGDRRLLIIPLLVNFQESGRWRDLTYSGSEHSLED